MSAPFFPYNFVPQPNNDPSVDQPNMTINTNSIFGLISQDHIPFNISGSGWHTIIHQILQSTDPTAIPSVLGGIGQIYSKTVIAQTNTPTTDGQLFYRTPQGGISQLTGNNANYTGYQWIGGILIQWGYITPVGSSTFNPSNNSGMVTFKSSTTISFPNQCWMAWGFPFYSTTAPSIDSFATVYIDSDSLTNLSFKWYLGFETTKITYLGWVAIGS